MSARHRFHVSSLYINNVYQPAANYNYVIGTSTTTVTLNLDLIDSTVVQILLLSDQVSQTAFYTIPINLNNNPFNQDLTSANVGDIRSQYQSIFYNSPNTTGEIFGSNNYRDLGNLVPYGTAIIQNSASLVLPGTFLRKQNHNLFNALLFNSREYIIYKQLIVDTVNNYDYPYRYTPAEILNNALDIITLTKSQDQSFFWSDMLPSKAPYRSNTYTFANDLDSAIYPLSTVYNFSTANYNGVLVYLSTTVNNNIVQTQLVNNIDYVISTDSPSLTVNIAIKSGDKITINEYNQTYGSYIPNTPTKLGMYPATIPQVILDSDYMQPTYFILGHDGSYTKLYGDYNPTTGTLIDYRDQALLEFETRIYNNLKLSTIVPIQRYEIVPGFFRDSTYTVDEFFEIYSSGFLNWIGQNRLDYKTQLYNKNDPYTFNYTNSGNKLTRTPIQQGYWRGVYEYFYDTTTPNETPWEMLAFANEPSWWTDRYGPAPYTSDNLILWGDLEQGIIWNNGIPITVPELARPGLLSVLPVNSNGELVSPFNAIVGNYNPNTFQKDWKVGDDGPVELSYRRSSTYPFDLMRIYALTRPADFFNLGVDLDTYKYNAEFNQYLVNDRSHLNISNIEIYGNGTAKTSYINWIVDFEKQLGLNATENITVLLDNLDVRLVYRLAGYSDKTLLKFYVEKGTPNSRNASLLIPDESYAVLLYDNQPFDRITYSGVIVQQTLNGWTVFGNSQNFAYFRILDPKYNGNYSIVEAESIQVKVTQDFYATETIVPYGTQFYSVQEVAQFLESYGAWLKLRGMLFDQIENGVAVTWNQMIAEFLYWSQTGWEAGSVLTLNPAATVLTIDKESSVVQPLTLQQTNFVLNQNLYPIKLTDMSVFRDQTAFKMNTLNQGDTFSYGQFDLGNFEHGIVFNNVTEFNDIIYNLITGLRQSRISVRGTKTAEWNGTVNAYGFILNQDNVEEWSRDLKYTKGVIVKYKNKYWTALRIVEPSNVFNDRYWKETDYNDIQKGMLPNSSTRSYESTLYYDVNKANLEQDADLLGYSLIGYRPRDYLALADLTDVTQVNVYKNLIKNKGTRNAINAFKGANLPQGGIDYDVYENWAIKQGEFGGVLNNNFVEFKINQKYMTGNPSIVSLTNGQPTAGSLQEIPMYSLFNYGRSVSDPNILSTTTDTTSTWYPSAGYVNYNDVKMSSYFFSGLPRAVDKTGLIVPIQNFYVRNYLWLANFKERWEVYSWKSVGQVIQVRNNLNGSATVTFAAPHELSRLDPLAIINFATNVDGYYIVTNVVNLNEVTINLAVLTANQTSLQGRGIGLTFESQRVATPSDIVSLDLLEADFTKNTVWVDENDDGQWAVYRKSINYQYKNELTKVDSTKFGSAVAYTPSMGYLISDAPQGIVYRYAFNALSEQYDLAETLAKNASFGSKIVYANNIYVISEPTSVSPKVYIYTLNNSIVTDDILLYQAAITAPGGVTDWGSELSISNDTNWIYISDTGHTKVYVYRKDQIDFTAGYFTVGQTYTITTLGTTDFTALGAVENKVGITFVTLGIGSGTGTATQVTYQYSTVIDGSTSGLVAGDSFSKSLTTDYHGDTLVVGAPNLDYSASITDWGSAYSYQRTVQNIESQYTSFPYQPQIFRLAWTPDAVSTTATNTTAPNIVTLASASGIVVNDPIVFTGVGLLGTGIQSGVTYYVESIIGSDITLKTSRSTSTTVTVETFTPSPAITVSVQTTPLYVSVNGTLVQDNNYGVVGSTLLYSGTLQAGDIINVSSNKFTLIQTFTSAYSDRTNIQYSYDLDITSQGSELLIGSPYEIDDATTSTQNIGLREGAVYRYTNGGAKFGVVIGTSDCTLTSARQILINGYLVFLPIGNATVVAQAINDAHITNIEAAATTDNKLIIQVINVDLTQINEKLLISTVDVDALTELGIQVFTETQVIKCPRSNGQTQFGKTIKFNEFDNVVIAAPVGTRYAATTFDFTDDENIDNDTIFDNNATRFVEASPNAGAVYMFDYLANYNESLANPGAFVYAQSVNNKDQDYGFNPLYGAALDFNDNIVVVGAPDFSPGSVDGQVVIYQNLTGLQDWSVLRQSAPVVDINKIQNTQIFSASTNNTLVNLDYIDPLQGKILGAVRQNIDFVTNVDPAKYNSDLADQTGYVWGADHVGQIWFNTTNVRFVNYHQDDPLYNSQYWGTIFPGSDVAVFSWIASFNPPNQYSGPGRPIDVNLYSINSVLNASNVVVPIYYFWVRNANLIFSQQGKTLSDNVIAAYIANPRNSGIAYMAPLLPNAFALYNSADYFNANDSVFHIGFGTGTSDDVMHQEFNLIRENYPDDFLPGVPAYGSNAAPQGLYDRFVDSLSGCDETGGVVPNPFLPKAVQSGVLARPRQSFFYNRLVALKNYLQYANEVLAQVPISETRREALFLYEEGDSFSTPVYWSFINWWATGYNNNTKSAQQVAIYADLARLTVASGTIVTVEQNGDGKFEVYRYDGNSIWTRIGLQTGTIEFSSYLWNYAEARLGFGDNFYDTNIFDQYPSEETRYIIRALNEQIYIDELIEFRNKSLVLMFEYIQSETTESQNFLPWLNKTSLVDVNHTIRELLPVEVFQSDNQVFLEGYINEVKPYHVVIKEFSFKYTRNEPFEGDITDFDLPATYNSTYEQYISPQLVYGIPNNEYEYSLDDPIWSTTPYNQWFANHGLSLVGQPDYKITVLQSFLTLGTRYLIVDNAQGFPINGTIMIGDEMIGYSSVDRSLNSLSGLIRGINNTTIVDHIPGENIIIDLPAVVVLDGGRGYVEPPRVTAYIDETLYPAPTVPAVLEAVMSLDSVIQINVINPGQGYAVLPKIQIDAAVQLFFSNTDINSTLHTIRLYAPNLRTGDLVQYKIGIDGATVGRLADGEWYYINLLESTPTAIIALYTSYSNAVKDKDRVAIYNNGDSSTLSLNFGAKASAISSSSPVRENNIKIKFDRTTYDSWVTSWESSQYYGSFFAGSYSNSENVASSAIQLESTQPPIASVLASAQGVAFEITDVANDQVLEWSSLIRYVASTLAVTDSVRLIPQDGNNPDLSDLAPNASGTTTGFYIGMPIKFIGVAVGGLIEGQTYFVHSILNELDFTLSTVEGGDPSGLPVALTNSTVGAQGLQCYTGTVTDTAVLTVNYPGIMEVTATQASSNKLTVPLTLIGTGGTNGFYVNIPLFFTGNVFGGIIENQIYYITTVIDNQTFTMSATQNPLTASISETSSVTKYVIMADTTGFSVNDPIVFNTMVVAGSSSNSFGNIVSGTVYYVSAIISDTELQISTLINGGVFNPGTVAAATNTSCLLTNQKDTVVLTTASGSMTMNVSLPVSPGQINGQLFTLYATSEQYPNINTGTISNLIERAINATIHDTTLSLNRVAISESDGGTEFFYVNMPIRVATPIGGLTTDTNYYITEYSGMEDPLNSGEYLPNIEVAISATLANNQITCDTTASLYDTMPIVFTGVGLGGITIGQQYFVNTIDVDGIHFTVSATPGGTTVDLTASSGSMLGTGDPYIVVSASLGGSAVILSDNTDGSNLTQYITLDPVFDMSYILGGYRAIISTAGSGFAINNVISISGTEVDGLSPTNDITLTVNTIGTIGEITSVICAGTVPETPEQYYLKVRSPNTLGVYSNAPMTVPASGLTLPYTGFTTTTATATATGTNIITVTSSSDFNDNDPVVFTGTVFGNIVLGTTYYILSTPTPTTVTISSTIGGIIFPLAEVLTGSMTMAKAGSFALLPEPFYFNSSIVRFNGRVYVCVVSNNDTEFVLGKWELLDSGDRRLNAMDRVVGYYQPTSNMPGLDLSQLFEGVTYPNSTYFGNRFAPDQQFQLDTILNDQPFYPTEVNITSVLWNGHKYYAASNLPEYSAVLGSLTGDSWNIAKLANVGIGATDIIYAGGFYVMTSTNSATPVFRSNDGVTWTTNGYFTPYGSLPFDENPYDTTAISIAALALNAVAYHNGYYVAVGDNIVRSADTYIWREVNTFPPSYGNQLYGVASINISAFSGLIAVGKGTRPEYSSGITELVATDLILYSTTGEGWTQIDSITPSGLYGITSSDSLIIAVGENGVIYYSNNGANWTGLNQVECTFVNSSSSVLSVTGTTGFSLGDTVRFSESFSTLLAGTTYYIAEVISSTQVTLSTSPTLTPIVTLTEATIAMQTMMHAYDAIDADPATLRDVIYANSIWVAVGDTGTIKTSPDGIAWTKVASSTDQDLNGITWNSVASTFTIVGDNNVILASEDNGVTWNSTSLFTIIPTVYDVQGAEFSYGYGPEELVPGIVTDLLQMTVTTSPGTVWPIVEYSHNGYNSVSVELTPTSSSQTEYSFYDAVHYPAQIAVQILDATTLLGTTLNTSMYSVDWITKTLTLNTPIEYSPTTQKLRIDVYEVGNGNQLVKSNSDTDPIRTNNTTGFDEIYLNCNYSDNIYNGSGVIEPASNAIEVEATATDAYTDSITCASVVGFNINGPITFQGITFGGVDEEVVYYVKSISSVTSSITISASYNSITGLAGPTLALTTATGSMLADIQNGTGSVWTDPIVYHNGTQLVLGKTNLITRTKASNNAITTNSTGGLIVGTPITFSNTMFGDVILPLITYYIATIIDGNEFTISETANGPVLVLTDATGGASYITNDYAFGIQPNGIQAKMMFSTGGYDNSTDYLVYSVFGESTPYQYSFTLPQTQEFTGNGSQSTFALNNYVGEDNPNNAIVQVNGIRQTISQYTISTINNSVNFVNPPPLSSVVSVTTFNDTSMQYMHTQFGITGTPGSSFVSLTISTTTRVIGTYDQDTPIAQTYDQDTPSLITYDEDLSWLTISSGTTGSLNINDSLTFTAPTLGGIVAGQVYYVTEILSSSEFVISEQVGGEPVALTNDTGAMLTTANVITVSAINNINNAITAPLAVTFATASTSGTNQITVDSSTGFVQGQTVIFQGTSFGDIETDGTVYFVESYGPGYLTIMDQDGTQIVVIDASGNMQVTVGGLPAVRVTTAIPNMFNTNELILISGTTGTIQLNDNAYYARVITDYTFDLYTQPYGSAIEDINYPVTTIAAYTGGGFTWRAGTFFLVTTNATQTYVNHDDHYNAIKVTSTANLIVGTPILFTEFGSIVGASILGGLIQGTTYYVSEIYSETEFSVSAVRYGTSFTLTNDTGTVNVTQWEQINVDRLWITVNGLRVPSSKLRISIDNEVSILTQIVPGDEVIITNMIPYATSDEEIYINIVDQTNQATVYRANTQTRTWLMQPVYDLSTLIYVNNVQNLTDVVVQDVITPDSVDGYYYIGLNADKNILTGVQVLNNTTGNIISSDKFEVIIIDTSPILQIKAGSYITAGDSLTLSSLEGNIILINGEQIKFSSVDFVNNTLGGIQRGVNGTAEQTLIPTYSEVYGLLSSNELPSAYYDVTWNSYVFNTTLGDPLQISQTVPAQFLNVDIT